MSDLRRIVRRNFNYDYNEIVGPTKLTYDAYLYLRRLIKLTTYIENCNGFSNLLLEQKRRKLSVVNL